MPIMSKEQIWLHGEKFYRIVKWSKRSEEFLISLPDYVSKSIGQTRVIADTMREVVKKFDTAIEKYDKAATSKKKIICYEYSGSIRLEKGNPRRKADNIFNEDHPNEMVYDVEFKFTFWVGHELKIGEEKQYIDIHGERKSVNGFGDDSERVISWTIKREKFFRRLVANLAKTHRRATRFFEQDQKTILALIQDKTARIGFDGA